MPIYIKGTDGCCDGCGPDDPCEAPAAPTPTLVCDSITATLTKCGFSEFGTPSSPPKVYRTKTASGTTDWLYSSPDSLHYVWSGARSYSRPDCTLTDDAKLTLTNPPSGGAPVDIAGTPDDYDGICGLFYGDKTWDSGSGGCNTPAVTPVVSTTVTAWDWSTSTDPLFSGTNGATLSDEYTTAHLKDDVIAALPAYPGTFAGSCSSYCSLSSDEATYTVRRRRFKFTLPSLTGYTTYKIAWEYIFTRASDSATFLVGYGNYVWDGVATETPVYGSGFTDLEYEPCQFGSISGSTDVMGKIEIANIVATC